MNRIKLLIASAKDNQELILNRTFRIGIPVAGVAMTLLILHKALSGPSDILEEWAEDNTIES